MSGCSSAHPTAVQWPLGPGICPPPPPALASLLKKPARPAASGHPGGGCSLNLPPQSLRQCPEELRAPSGHRCVGKAKESKEGWGSGGASSSASSPTGFTTTPSSPASFLSVEKMVSSLSQSTGSKQLSGNIVEFKSKHTDSHIHACHFSCPFLKHKHSYLMATHTHCGIQFHPKAFIEYLYVPGTAVTNSFKP